MNGSNGEWRGTVNSSVGARLMAQWGTVKGRGDTVNGRAPSLKGMVNRGTVNI